jgi:thiol-disulfide isomerase/thioredoxin
VLLDFGADWCPDCVVLARMFESAAFADYLSGVHVVRIDVGYWDHNLDVSKRYGDPIAVGIPAVVLVSPAGDVLGTTADGRLASAASMTPDKVLAVLRSLGG